MNKRKRIAILVGQAEEEYQEQFISGFLSQIFKENCDVCVFATYQRKQETAAREVGESSIFSLIQYELFDAVVLMIDTIQTPGIASNIEKTVKQRFKGPVLCVDVESKYFPHIEMDYYKPVKKLVSHLIEHHGFNDIAYLTGPQGHKHSMQRLKAYEDCMEEHGLPIGSDRIFYGDFWYGSGEQTVEKLLKQGGKMPQAIACANDYMAIAVAKTLTKYGLRVPEDVAVIGYESVEAGKDSPKPITSAPMPTRKYGVYAAECVKALFEGRELTTFEEDVELFIGSSCGCHNDSVVPKILLRERWDTEMSAKNFYSLSNHMNEDLLCQTTFYGLMTVLDSYVYHIRDFDSFHICLNEDWNDFEKKAKEGRQDESYSKRMLHVLSCGAQDSNQDIISFDTYFKKELLLPEIHEQHEKPRAYFFTPLYFEEKSFGYAVICYENRARSYNATYRMWLRNAMQEFECFRRIEAIQRSNQMLEASMTRDALTGLYNYNGFSKEKDKLVRKILQNHLQAGVLAIDLKELMKINEVYGRAEGDRAIIAIAHILEDIFPDGMSVCLGNGEMIVILLSNGDVSEALQKGYENLLQQIDNYNQSEQISYKLEMYYGIETGLPQNEDELERLVNIAVSKKNGHKVSERKMQQGEKLTEIECAEAEIVQALLDNNRLNYHFQPIVDAKNGEIFGYEALMRPDVDPYLPPPVVLKYAEYYGRLYDVEKATFYNVLELVNSNREIFDGKKKVFINSIPGNLLHGEDAKRLEAMTEHLKNTVVVELTEQLELADDELSTLKEYYNKVGFQTAIDDYGSGYSNVTNLLRYMPNCVKIDRMLLINIQDSPQKQHFVKDIIDFSHDNDILALAEGVETKEELQMVIHLGADLIQGYYTAKPSKEIVPSISMAIKKEIIDFNRIESHNRERHVYVARKESKISLARLAAEKYSIIEIAKDENACQDVTILGVPDLETDVYLRIKNGYRGRIILNNVTLQGGRQGASIDIENDCEVELVLQGENRCLNGGIRVPEGSKLTIEGDGYLFISVDAANYFGIGNNIDAKHGEMVLKQAGTIEIKVSGMKGVGIGSGLGGSIRIQKGKYVLRMMGQEGVGVGSFSGNIMPVVTECDMQVNVSASKAVGIGSMEGDVQLRLENSSFIGEFSADNSIGIGTLEGKKSHIEIIHANILMNVHGQTACGIGAHHGEVLFHLDNANVLINGDGPEVLAIGNQLRKAKVIMSAAKIDSKISNSLNTDIGVEEKDIYIESGELLCKLNGERVVRRSE